MCPPPRPPFVLLLACGSKKRTNFCIYLFLIPSHKQTGVCHTHVTLRQTKNGFTQKPCVCSTFVFVSSKKQLCHYSRVTSVLHVTGCKMSVNSPIPDSHQEQKVQAFQLEFARYCWQQVAFLWLLDGLFHHREFDCRNAHFFGKLPSASLAFFYTYKSRASLKFTNSNFRDHVWEWNVCWNFWRA